MQEVGRGGASMLTLEWRELYQQVVLDHYRRPRNHRRLEAPARSAEGHNPLCGDRVTIFILAGDGALRDVTFQGSGCALCVASASLMTERLRGKTDGEAGALVAAFLKWATASVETTDREGLGDLRLFEGVREFPARVKCVTLAWHAARAALA